MAGLKCLLTQLRAERSCCSAVVEVGRLKKCKGRHRVSDHASGMVNSNGLDQAVCLLRKVFPNTEMLKFMNQRPSCSQVVGFEAEGLLILGHRFRQLALVLECNAQVVVSFGVVGFEAEGFLIVRHRFRQLTLIQESNAQIVVRLGVVGFEAEGFLIVRHRFRQCSTSSLSLEGIAQVVVRFGEVGFEAEGLLIVGHRFRQRSTTSLLLEGAAQVVMCLGVVGFEAKGLLIPAPSLPPTGLGSGGCCPGYYALRRSRA